MPMRRDGDTIEEIESFDEWVHDRLEEAIARGEFDNLPQKGKPIRIESNPFQPELDLAFSRLKNAGMAPAWIEMDRDILRMQEALDRWLEGSARRLATEAARIRQLEAMQGGPQLIVDRPWYRRWWPFRLFAVDTQTASEVDVDREWRWWEFARRRDREHYLQRSAQLDTRIQLFNNSIPRNLWHLEKLRVLPSRAEECFDTTVPLRSDVI